MKASIKLMILLFLAVMNSQCNNGQTGKAKTDSNEVGLLKPVEFSKQSSQQIVVDVRTPKEYNSGHIKEAINIDFRDEGFTDEISKLKKDVPVFLYCRSGGRSGSAAKSLKKMGFKHVFDLEGGVLNWSKNNLELVK